MHHIFNFPSREIINHLFKKYFYILYGIEQWFNDIKIDGAFHNVSVGYHKAVNEEIHID